MNALSYEQYERLSAPGGLVPVYRELPGDLLTPVSAFRALASRAERAFLLESIVGGERIARYSFLGRDPVSTIEVREGTVVELGLHGPRAIEGDLLGALRSRVGRR